MPRKVNKGSEAYIRRSADARVAMGRVTKRLNKVLAKIRDLTGEEVEALAKTILRRSLYLTPVDTGRLRESSFIRVQKATSVLPVSTGGLGNAKIRATIGYGRNNMAPYATFVHEIVENYHEAPTQAKFLQTAVLEATKIIPKSIQQRIRRELKNG